MNFTAGNLTTIKLDVATALTRNSRTLNNPIVGLLLAAGILARIAQAKQTSSAALINPWHQLQSISSGATPVQIVPSQSGVQPPYGYYPPPYPLAAPPGAYPWWYAVEPFNLYPINGAHPQVLHVHDVKEEHEQEEHKDGISYPEDHEEEHGHEEHHYNSHEIQAEHSAEGGDHSAPGSYESESENIDKQVVSNEIPIPPNNQIKPVKESAEESKLEPVVIQTSPTESSLKDEAVLPAMPNSPLNSTLLNEATRTVQNIVDLLQKFEGNYSRIKTVDPIKQRPNNHQLVLDHQQYAIPKNSVTNILVQLNTTSASELVPDDDRIAEASDMSPVQLGGSPLILAMAGAAQTVRRQHRPNAKQPSNGRKGTTTTRRPSNNKTQNRQRPQQRKPTTPRLPVMPTYDDDDYEYEYTTPRYKPTKRSTIRRKPDYRRSTAPPRRYDMYDYDNYQTRTQSPSLNRRKQGVNIYNKNRNNYNNRMKPISMSAYDDDFDDSYNDDPSQYYNNDDYGYKPAQAQAQIDYADYRDDKDHEGNGFVARQGGNTEAPDYEDENTTESNTSAGTTVPTPASTVPTSQTPTTTESPTPPPNVTISPTGYPYGPGSNTSFTYGPPVHPHQSGYGYGPSNGNENISITYGPPTAGGDTGGSTGTGGGGTGGGGGSSQQYIAAGGPSLDWYNQYAKQNVFKRIQDLLAPNNFYSPQYDSDKYNYNDNTF